MSAFLIMDKCLCRFWTCSTIGVSSSFGGNSDTVDKRRSSFIDQQKLMKDLERERLCKERGTAPSSSVLQWVLCLLEVDSHLRRPYILAKPFSFLAPSQGAASVPPAPAHQRREVRARLLSAAQRALPAFLPFHTRSATPHQASPPRPPTRYPDSHLSEHDSEMALAALSTVRFFFRSEMTCSAPSPILLWRTRL